MTAKKFSKNAVDSVLYSLNRDDLRSLILTLCRCCYYHDLINFRTVMEIMEFFDSKMENSQCRNLV